MTILYAAPRTVAVAVALTLEEVGMAYDLRLIDFSKGDQLTDAYRDLNPKARVPAFITETGILTETGSILEYIAAMNADAGLVPTDPFQSAKMREMMYYLASTMHVNHAHKMRGARWSDDPAAHKSMQAKVAETMTASCAYVEDFLSGPNVLGQQITLADIYLYTVTNWAEGDGVDLAAFPKLVEFRLAFSSRDSVTAVTDKGLL